MKRFKRFLFAGFSLVFLFISWTILGQNLNSKIPSRINEPGHSKPDISKRFHPGLDVEKLKQFSKELKYAKEVHFVMDTVLIFSINNIPERHIYSYSTSGYYMNFLIQYYEGNNWINSVLEACTYDQEGNKLISFLKVWINNEWVNYQTETNKYVNARIQESLKQRWIEGAWMNAEKETFAYDSGGNMISYLSEYWLKVSWVYLDHYLFTYDENGHELTGFYEKWENGGWKNVARYTYMYNVSGDLITELSESWLNSTWTNAFRDTYIYDGNRKLKTSLSEIWSNGFWLFYDRYTYTYDVSGRVSTGIGERFENGVWKNYEKGAFSYAFYDGIQSFILENWDNSAWVNSSMATYDYDNSGNAVFGVFYTWDGQTWAKTEDGPLDIYFDYSKRVESYVGLQIQVSYKSFEMAIDGKNEDILREFSCRPNPATDYSHIMVNVDRDIAGELFVSTLTGQRLFIIYNGTFEKGKSDFLINTSTIPAGLYLVSCSTKGFVRSEKLMVTK